VADGLEFTLLNTPGLHWLGRSGSLKCLNGGQFITTDNMPPQSVQQRSIGVECGNTLDLSGKLFWVSVLGLGVQPIAAAMWL
jgi:hypothetical protein